MPTKYNTEETKESARYIAEKLGVQYLVIPISKLEEFNRLILKTHTDTQTLDMVLEQNIQV